MSRTWCRLYTGTRNHRKIKILRERLPKLWTYWYVLIELAGEIDDGGWIYLSPNTPFTDKQLSQELGMKRLDYLQSLCRVLVELDLVTVSDKGILLNSFSDRNFESDKSTARVQKYREKAKQELANETFQCNANVTPQNRTDTETEQKQNILPPTPKGGINGFESFWSAYPKKIGKGAAIKKWEGLNRLGRLPPLDKLIAAVERQKNWDQWQKDEGQFIPNPATWLNQSRWDDEQTTGGPTWIQDISRPASTN